METNFRIGGNLTGLNQLLQIKLPGNASTLSVQISGTFSASIQLQQTADDGEHWTTIATLTSAGLTSYPVASMTDFRALVSVYASGNIGVSLLASVGVDSSSGSSSSVSDVNTKEISGSPVGFNNPLPVELSDGTNPLGVSGNPVHVTLDSEAGAITANQGAPNTLANAWPVEISDGTNLLGTAAHPVRTDPTGTTTQPVSGTVTSKIVGNAGAVIDGPTGTPSAQAVTIQPIADQAPATQNITAFDVGTTTATGINGQSVVTGSPTANSAATFSLTESDTVFLQVTGNLQTGAGGNPTYFVEASIDGANYFPCPCGLFGTNTVSTSFVGNFATIIDTAGIASLRVRCTGSGSPSGTAVAKIISSLNTQYELGSSGVPIAHGNTQKVSVTWTSATTINTTLVANVQGQSAVTLLFSFSAGTLTGGQAVYEGSDTAAFTNPYPLSAAVLNVPANIGQSISFNGRAATNVPLTVNTGGFAYFRVRLSVALVGTSQLSLGIVGTSAPNGIPVGGLVAVTSSGVIIPVGSSTAQAAIGDNVVNVNTFGNTAGNNNELAVALAIYGGAWSGTANASASGWSKWRTPTQWKASAQLSAAATTAVWTPQTSNKYRLLSGEIILTANAATSGGAVVTVTISDSVSGLQAFTADFYVPAVAVTTTPGCTILPFNLGQFGFTGGGNLNVTISAALTSGNVRVNVRGTEE